MKVTDEAEGMAETNAEGKAARPAPAASKPSSIVNTAEDPPLAVVPAYVVVPSYTWMASPALKEKPPSLSETVAFVVSSAMVAVRITGPAGLPISEAGSMSLLQEEIPKKNTPVKMRYNTFFMISDFYPS